MEIYKLKWNYFILHLTLIHQSVILSRYILPLLCSFVVFGYVVGLQIEQQAMNPILEKNVFADLGKNRGNMSVYVPLTAAAYKTQFQ